MLQVVATNLFVDTSDPLWKVGEGVQGEVINGLLDLGEDLTERSGIVRTGLQSTDLQVDLFLHGKQVINLTWKKTKRPEFGSESICFSARYNRLFPSLIISLSLQTKISLTGSYQL